MHKRMIIQFVLLLVVVFFLSLIAGSLIHEGAHIVVQMIGGSQLKEVVVMPGIQLYPRFALVHWSGYVAGVSLTKCSEQYINGLSLMMGSSLNAIASYLLLAIIFRFPINGRKKFVILLTSFILAWDLIGYSIFPLLSLRHWIFIGGNYCEPIAGASMLGIPIWLSYFIVFAHFVFYHFFFVKMFSSVAKNIFSINKGFIPPM